MKILGVTLVVFAMLATSGCTILPEPQEVALYQLPEPRLQASERAPAPWSLRIKTPKASDALNSKRLLVLNPDNELALYSGARWTSTTPKLWQDYLQRAFLADGRIASLTTDAENLHAEVELSGTLRGFYAEADKNNLAAVIRFDATLADTASRKIIASRSFIAREPVGRGSSQSAALVAAFGVAADRVSADLLNWMLQQDSKNSE
ncbi:MAG: ABC-type transport auxiliary lipoprotein family protein [Porticoccaceae bacterium]|nr:ABC-type transport auxiliary lipoprotein family protein [Porticoccaceae bacterium]